jgi:hypothetical protein
MKYLKKRQKNATLSPVCKSSENKLITLQLTNLDKSDACKSAFEIFKCLISEAPDMLGKIIVEGYDTDIQVKISSIRDLKKNNV